MPRSRLLRSFLLLGGLAGVLYLMVSFYLPSTRRLIFGIHKRTGDVRVVRSNVTFLPPHQFHRLEFEKRGGAAQRDGTVRIVSKEQVPVTVHYRLRFSIVGHRLQDARTLVNEGWTAWIRKRVSEVVSAVAHQVPVEDLLSPTSDFSARREPLRRAVAAHLARSGLRVTAFEIVRMEPDREALLRFKRAELRRSARGVAGRVAIFAIDGADWDLLTELSYDQRLPNLRALIAGGTIGSLQTVQPTVSPLVWTTIATGLPPDRHGILDFIDRDRNLPVDGWSRREPALWDISEAFGRHAMVVNWWTAWPPTSPETFAFDAPVDLQPGAIHPAGPATARARQYTVLPETVGEEQVRRFLNITSAEYQQAVDRGDPRDPVNVFRKVLSKTWSDHRVAINSYAQQQPLLFMMSYEGTDVVNHLFGPFHPPLRDYVSQENYRRYWPAVANYYAEIDRLIGEWMNILPADTTVMIVSGHGFRWGKERPRTLPAGRSALSDHRNPGVFIAYGNHVQPSRAGRAISAYDIAPTVLAILGLPQSLEMPGSVATWPFRDISPMQSVRVVSYREFMDTRPRVAGGGLSREKYESALQTIGHLVDPSRPTTAQEEGQIAEARPVPPEQWSAYASQNNLGIEMKRQGKNKEAIEAFHRAIEINYSRPVPFLNLAFVLLERQQYTAAEDVLMSAVNRGLPNADQWIADMAAYYRERNMTSRAIVLLYKGKQLFPQSYVIAVNLGSALAAASRYTEALPELERALGLRPSSTVALNSLGMFYAKKNDFGRALDFWNRSLAIKPQPEIQKAAEAARSRL